MVTRKTIQYKYQIIPSYKNEACVICGEKAQYYAPVSDEPLCNSCCEKNDEAFIRR